MSYNSWKLNAILFNTTINLRHKENFMNKSIAFFFLLITVVAFTPVMPQQTCGDPLFLTQNDLVSGPGGTPHPCIKAYSGAYYLLAGGASHCAGPAFGMTGGTSGFIVFGPTVNSSSIVFDYEATRNTPVHVQTSISSTGPWADLNVFNPNNNCQNYTTSTIAANMYYKIYQEPAGGGPSGPYFVRSMYPATPLPVELTSFRVGRIGARALLAWRTATETNNYGFEIQRSTETDQWTNVGFVRGHGTVNTPQSYSFSDLPPAEVIGEISYRLRQIDRDGKEEYSRVVTVQMGNVGAFGLKHAYPNPFNPTTSITFAVQQTENITLSIIDQNGREVSRLMNNELLPAGSYSQLFQAPNLPSGDYYAWMYSASASSVLKLYLVK